SIPELRKTLDAAAKAAGKVAVLSAGWDPGSDSVVRALMEACAPKGVTYTNFGPGMSMGHTVAAKGKAGVAGALSVTIPLGTGVHRRMVYVQLEKGADIEQVTRDIKADPYFAHDETHVIQVDDIDMYIDKGHGVLMSRKGVSGKTDNQLFEFSMKITNPALTSQVMVACARASMRQTPGAYTMIELPVIDLLPGARDAWIGKLV
ncbi:MAG: diaminopimelate dehydrogenase, partial [Oscillospiraceae bacterium]|nr:diaminopimelate dehydrogenase [Oscillospiraceae bacterium]